MYSTTLGTSVELGLGRMMYSTTLRASAKLGFEFVYMDDCLVGCMRLFITNEECIFFRMFFIFYVVIEFLSLDVNCCWCFHFSVDVRVCLQ